MRLLLLLLLLLKNPGSSVSQFWGFLSIYVYTLCRRTTKFHVVTHMVRGLFVGGQLCPTPKWRGTSAPNSVPFYFCLHPLSHNCQISRGNTWGGEERVSRAQPHLPSQENGVLALPIFGGYPAFMPTSFNAERPNSAW